MEPSVKKLVIVGALGLVVTWGTYIYLELKPETADVEQLAQESNDQKNAKKTKPETPVSKRRQSTPKKHKPTKAPAPEPVPSPPQPPVVQAPPSPVPNPPPSNLPIPQLNAPNPTADRFSKLETQFESETRDATWADEKEKRIVELFKKGGFEQALVDVSCRKTVCKLELKLERPEVLLNLIKMPGLSEEVGQDAATRPLGAPGNQKVISYFARKSP
jgi:hypothetical protein